jgi:phage terminase large subunit GpA-like protein
MTSTEWDRMATIWGRLKTKVGATPSTKLERALDARSAILAEAKVRAAEREKLKRPCVKCGKRFVPEQPAPVWSDKHQRWEIPRGGPLMDRHCAYWCYKADPANQPKKRERAC